MALAAGIANARLPALPGQPLEIGEFGRIVSFVLVAAALVLRARARPARRRRDQRAPLRAPRHRHRAGHDRRLPGAGPAAARGDRRGVSSGGTTAWVLGDQLSRSNPALDGADRVLMVESEAKLRSLPFHRQKLHLVLSAMRRRRLGRARWTATSPPGGRWNFDAENRRPPPADRRPPRPYRPREDEIDAEVRRDLDEMGLSAFGEDGPRLWAGSARRGPPRADSVRRDPPHGLRPVAGRDARR